MCPDIDTFTTIREPGADESTRPGSGNSVEDRSFGAHDVPVIEHARGLRTPVLQSLAELERRVVAVDGGRLKLEWPDLRGRRGDLVEDLLWWEGDRLLGFLGLYDYGVPTVELTGMVDPSVRRRGIATALLAAALPLCRERGFDTALLVVPREGAAAHALASSLGAALARSEHALELLGEPAGSPTPPELDLRPLVPDDIPAVDVLFAMGFGQSLPAPQDEAGAERLRLSRENTLVIHVGGAVVGAMRLIHDGEGAGVYGLVVRPDHRGRGLGREALRRACLRARAEGASRVQLEVAVENDTALGLYTSLGFTRVTTEDYYALPF
ncbi:MAG: hypothetical protein QG608_1366 [Actinomycetota bacterium]|nr:hypothetical protein [Actinomycetota bacterium]